jgi:LPS sulfotransferase NodH
MWGTIDPLAKRLGHGGSDLDVLEKALGALQFVFIRRTDVLAQAVSWARSEQTGYWQHGDRVAKTPIIDLNQIGPLVRTIEDHNASWSRWFAQLEVRPHLVVYEDLVDDPRQTILDVLAFLNIDPPPDWRAVARQPKQADALNAEWIAQYRRQ